MNDETTTTKAAIIHTSGFLESVDISGLEDMQRAVGGNITGYPMEHSELAEPLAPHEGKFEVYVHSRGLIERLPLNLPAALSMAILVHGDVLVTGKIDDEGAITDLPTEVWHELPRMLRDPTPSIYRVDPSGHAVELTGGDA